MTNTKFFFSLLIGCAILGGVFFVANRAGWFSLHPMVRDNGANPESSLASSSGNQTVPEEFIDLEGKAVDYDEQDAGNQQFAAMTTQTLWQSLLDGFKKPGSKQINVENALIARLRKEPATLVYQDMLSQFKKGALDTTAQQVLVSILGEVGNYKAAETLMRLVSDNLLQIPDVRLSAFHAISKFAPESWQDTSKADLAPVFESAWQKIEDTEFLGAIANVMANIGAPSTLDIFIKTLSDNNDPARTEIAEQAMTNLANPALIPKLGDLLQKSPLEDIQFASGSTLANMGQLEAAEQIFYWAAQKEANRAEYVRELVERAMNTTPEFISFLEENLATQKFVAEENKAVIKESLETIKEGVE